MSNGIRPKTLREAADWLIRTELGSSRDPDQLADAVKRLDQGLFNQLVRWIGRDGCQALGNRALGKVERAHPVLERAARQEDGTGFMRLNPAAVQEVGHQAVIDSVRAWLTAYLDLLTRFVGEEMAIRLVVGSWPSTSDAGRDDGRGED